MASKECPQAPSLPPPPLSPSSIFVFALYPTWEPVHKLLITEASGEGSREKGQGIGRNGRETRVGRGICLWWQVGEMGED